MTITLPTTHTLQHWLYTNLGQRVRPKELLLFYTQITILIESGTSVPLGLEALEKQMPTGYLKQIVGDLKLMVREGQMLSDAMAKYPKVFSPVYVGMIRAGERGGFLPKVLQRIVMLQEQKNELRSTLSSAFAYPLLLMMVSLSVVMFMLTFILPKFIDVYAGSGVPLPLLTQLLLATYMMFSNYWFIGLPLLGGGLWAGCHYACSPRGRALLDSLLVDVPLIRSLSRLVYLEQLLRTLGILLDSGVPIYDAIILTRNTLTNHRYVQLMTLVLNNVSAGQGLAASFSQSDLIPPTVRQMVQAGEAAGAVGTVMSRVANFYFERIREQMRILTRSIEPIMTLVMGAIVGTVALALVLPILQLARTINSP